MSFAESLITWKRKNKQRAEFKIKTCQDCPYHILVSDIEEYCIQYAEEIPSLDIALKDRNSKPDFCKLSKIILEFEE